MTAEDDPISAARRDEPTLFDDDELDSAPAPEPAVVDQKAKGGAALVVASGLAAIFFLLAVVMTIVAAQASSDQREDTGARQDVNRVAGQLAEALLSYDYQDLAATQEAVLALATGGFSTQVREDFPRLEETITSLEARATATVRGVYVGDVGDDAATALVVVDQIVTTNAGGERPQPTIYLQLDLVNLAAGWRVDSVVNLNLAVLGDISANAGGGSTTTAPEATTTTAPSG